MMVIMMMTDIFKPLGLKGQALCWFQLLYLSSWDKPVKQVMFIIPILPSKKFSQWQFAPWHIRTKVPHSFTFLNQIKFVFEPSSTGHFGGLLRLKCSQERRGRPQNVIHYGDFHQSHCSFAAAGLWALVPLATAGSQWLSLLTTGSYRDLSTLPGSAKKKTQATWLNLNFK